MISSLWIIIFSARRSSAATECPPFRFEEGDLELGASVLRDETLANRMPARQLDGVVGAAVGDETSGRRWFGDVFGVRMLVSTLPADVAGRMPALVGFLRASEPRWRRLRENPEWPRGQRGQLTSKYRFYNALAEAVASDDGAVAAAGAALRRTLASRLAELMSMYASGLPCDDDAFAERTKPVDPLVFGPRHPPTPPDVHVQSWLNIHRADVAGEEHLEMHAHDFSWHGYLLLDAGGTNTTYRAPPSATRGQARPVFNLVNADEPVLVLLSGGIDHAVPAPPTTFERPRLSMAFDFAFSFAYQGKTVAHPGADFSRDPRGARLLPSDGVANSWAPFLLASDLDAALGGEPPTAFDWAAVRADADTRAAGASFWAGAVDVASLLRPRSSSPAGDEL